MSLQSILKSLGTAYENVNQFMVDNPMAVAAARQGLNYAMAQGRGPRMHLPTAYHTKGDALTGRTRMQTANRGMRLMKKGGRMYENGGREPDELLASLAAGAASGVGAAAGAGAGQIGRKMGRTIGTGMYDEMVQEALAGIISTIGAEQAKMLIDQMIKSGKVGKEAGMMMGSGIE